ncbi:hypothetical protein CRG98_019577 [Punica granatum]|uniref:Uncharacterized protein n=1 Tax=Punica granatum TaxID=22663 RepID=A0A2I0JUN3_PUNGR|nr:hypothetical protein CRG98_019577 [Punica granatum]
MAQMGFHKSWDNVRESGDSVERLEECSGARVCTFEELGARGVRLECTGGAREASDGGQTHAREGRRAGAHGRPRAAGPRVRVCATTGVLFTREHVLHPKSPK